MDKNAAIVLTGASGFIGSCMVQYLNDAGFQNLILVDDFSQEPEFDYLSNKKYAHCVDRNDLFAFLGDIKEPVAFFLHLGARTDTTEFDYAVHQKLNVDYSISVWHYCSDRGIPLIYASSAATYGSGEMGYSDLDPLTSYQLRPLNPYGVSKNEFDRWALQQKNRPPFWSGLKFFNVYGPNEEHKGRMASVVWHSFLQIRRQGMVKLFKSHRDDFRDGEQLRDFIYVKDLLKVMFWMMEMMLGEQWRKELDGLYNLGTGKARSFYDLAAATFRGLDRQTKIEYIDMPEDIRDKYQYFTEAAMDKLRQAGYKESFYTLEEGVADYIRNYLLPGKNF